MPVDIDPYKPPEHNPDRKKTTQAYVQLGWKVAFFIYSTLIAMAMISVPMMPALSFFDFIDFVISIIATGALFGLSFVQKVGKVVFWRYFFYAALFESLLFMTVLPVFGVHRYGQAYQFSLTELVITVLVLVALHQYAYRRADIWRRTNQ